VKNSARLSLNCYFVWQVGFPDKFPNSQGWQINSTNHCQWCPAGSALDTCGMHHQSPINLERNRAIEEHPKALACVDGHAMAYYDSSCSWNELKQKNAFVIDRHALRIKQPLQNATNSLAEIACEEQVSVRSRPRQFGRMDFPEGFPDWWLLSHMDFHVPSEHTQDGKRYSGEIQMYHFYSVPSETYGIHNEVSRSRLHTIISSLSKCPIYSFTDGHCVSIFGSI
jgi:Eukaryotic-type carbonic anhydrase